MELTIDDLRSLIKEPDQELPGVLSEGNKVCIRTVTFHYLGRVVSVSRGAVHLDNACWLADSGRWCDFLKTGVPSECEIFPNGVSVMISSIVDICPFPHTLPTESK